MKHETYLTSSPYQTKKLAEKIAKKILRTGPKKKAVVLALEGPLGSGKTTFLQGVSRGLGIKEKVLSPTFVIMKKFQIPNSPSAFSYRRRRWRAGKSQINLKFQLPKFKTFFHLDCYRIKKPKEILDLGFKEIISNPKNIVAVEWADRIKKIIPKNAIKIKFNFIDKKKRKTTITNFHPLLSKQ